jgi:protein-disulfide isomerase
MKSFNYKPRRFASLGFAAALSVASFGALSACQQDNKAVLDKLAAIDKRLENIEKKGVGGAAGAAQRPQRPAPDPTKTYAVPVDDAPAIGNPNALITIVKAYEYACPFCEKARPTIEQIHKEYGDKVRVVYEPFVVHPQSATLPAQATCAAHRQGKFAEIDNLLWEKVFKERKFEEGVIVGLAKDGGLDAAKYQADMKSPECASWVQKHMQNLSSFGVGATPGFFINGRFLSGAQPFPAFKTVIDEELKKAEERVAQGTPASSYYKTWVIDKGLKKLDAPK